MSCATGGPLRFVFVSSLRPSADFLSFHSKHVNYQRVGDPALGQIG